MRMLVTGSGGFVGRYLCADLLRKGHSVRVAVRNANDIDGVDPVRVGDIDGNTVWGETLQGIEVVIHLAARVHVMRESSSDPVSEFRKVNVAGTERLARAAVASGVKRFVFVSSIKVNGEATSDDKRFSEMDAAAPQDPYGISKMEAERVLHQIARETGLEVVVVRPPLIYGAGVKGNFRQMLKVLGRGMPLPLASVQNLRSLVYVGNFVDALAACAIHPAAAGQTYLASDGEDISTSALLRLLGNAMGHPARLFPFPLVLLRLAGRLTGRLEQIERLAGSLQVDSGKISRELNWTPPYTLQQGLQATAEWYQNARL